MALAPTPSSEPPGTDSAVDWLEALAARTHALALRAERAADGRIVTLSWGPPLARERMDVPPEVWAWPHEQALAHVDALMRAHQAEQQLVRVVGEQVEGNELLVHDLRNPLAVITANLEYLRGAELGALDPELVGALGDASGAVSRIRSLLDDVGLVDRLAQGLVPVVVEPVKLAPLIAAITDTARVEARWREVLVESACPSGLAIDSSGELLTGLLQRLVEGRLRRIRRGGRVGVFAEVVGDRVRIRVADDGQPVLEEWRARIFDRAGPGRTQSRELGNIGVSLHLCHLIVQLLGGHITLTEGPLWPTCFVIDLASSPL